MSGHRGKIISEAEFKRMWLNPDLTIEAIAALLGVTVSAVSMRARVRKFPKRVQRGTKPKIKDDARFSAMWAAGVNRGEIAGAFGVCMDTVYGTARRMGLAKTSIHRGIPLADFEAMHQVAA